jgi:hypothetical protein
MGIRNERKGVRHLFGLRFDFQGTFTVPFFLLKLNPRHLPKHSFWLVESHSIKTLWNMGK